MTLFPLYLAICAVPAAAGVLFKPGNWYRELDKPAWTPPNRLFPVIWAAELAPVSTGHLGITMEAQAYA